MAEERTLNANTTVFESDVVPVSDAVVLTLREDFPHVFLGVQFFSDASGNNRAAATAGTLAVGVETVKNAGAFEDPFEPTITAATPETVSWDANTKSARVVPTGVTGAGFYKVVATTNKT